MTREEYIDFANALKNNYTIDFDKLPEFCDMAISALKGGWIPIEERKPHKYGNYYVTIEKSYGAFVEEAWFGMVDGEEQFIQGAWIPSNITAWREDIEPYKKGE
jgi:hypothetical protein